MRERITAACARAGRGAESVRLIAVTKNHSVDTVQRLIDLGVHDIGENRVQEIESKAPSLKGDFTLHMIGHLQTNKAQKVWPHVGWIQSIDRERLIERLDSIYTGGAKKRVLVEVNTSGEESKSGCDPQLCEMLCELVAKSKSLELKGLMTIGPLGGDELAVKSAFEHLRKLSEKCCSWIDTPELSMGMSGDFEWAIEQGSTMVRIGTALVGERE